MLKEWESALLQIKRRGARSGATIHGWADAVATAETRLQLVKRRGLRDGDKEVIEDNLEKARRLGR